MPEKVTDTHLLKLLAKQGIDSNYVELFQDYAPRSRGKEHTPYARFYVDRVSGKKIMVAGILPHVTNAGFSIDSKWRSVGNKFIAEENCFAAEIENRTIKVTCVNDQPNGAKVNDQLIWHPQVYLDGVEQPCGNPLWLDTDPTNPSYHFNVIEWDYGFCKCRVRIIEGRIRERWVPTPVTFTLDPDTPVRVKHNHTGKLRLKMGMYAVGDDEEVFTIRDFGTPENPFEVMASPETFYPDAGVASVDGYTLHTIAAGSTWGAIRDGAGIFADDSADVAYVQILTHIDADKWKTMDRAIFLFDTSGLPNNAIVSAATISFYGEVQLDNSSGFTPTYNVYRPNPNTDTALIAGDFETGEGKFEETALCDTAIAQAGWNVGTPGTINNFVLNAAGRATDGQLDRTGVSKYGLREATRDAADNPPTHESNKAAYISAWTTEKGAGYKPQLVVTYTEPPTAQAVGDGSVGIAGALGRNIFIGVGGGSVSIAGTLGLKIKLAVGQGAVTIVGTLVAAKRFVQAVGDGAVAIAGSLTSIKKIFANVGGGSVSIAGALNRKIKLAVGAGSVSIAGALNRKIKLAVGGGSITIVGTLGRLIKISVGSGAVTMASTLGWKWLSKKLKLHPFAYSRRKTGEGEQ